MFVHNTLAYYYLIYLHCIVYVIDHVNQVSAIVIIGSFSAIATKQYTEHYIFTAVSTTTEGVHHYEAFPEPDDVCIQSGESNLNMTWTSSKHGYFSIDNNICQLDFRLNGGTNSDNNNSKSTNSSAGTRQENKSACHIAFKSINRLPWSYDDPLTAGPEGWLGKSMLLPCHYYIYSTGSDVSYRIELEGPSEEGSIEHSNSGTNSVSDRDSLGSSRSGRVGSRVLTGQGHMHAEGNYG